MKGGVRAKKFSLPMAHMSRPRMRKCCKTTPSSENSLMAQFNQRLTSNSDQRRGSATTKSINLNRQKFSNEKCPAKSHLSAQDKNRKKLAHKMFTSRRSVEWHVTTRTQNTDNTLTGRATGGAALPSAGG